jgi:signal transduction histidine kinase/CheY-like chemotaxis protein/ABC-type amino acid transport substrate-binding protein
MKGKMPKVRRCGIIFAMAVAVLAMLAQVSVGSSSATLDYGAANAADYADFRTTTVSPYGAGDSVPTVRVGYFHMDGYNEMDEDGVLSGYDYDFFQLLGRYTNLNFEYVGYDKSWQEMQDMLDRGEIDVLTSMHSTEERQDKYLFSYDIGSSYTMITCKSGNSILSRSELSGYGTIRVGMLPGSSQNAVFEAYARNEGIEYTVNYYDDTEQLSEAVQSEEVDIAVTSSLRQYVGERIMDELETSRFYAVVTKDNQELMDTINYGIEQMDANEGDWRNTLYYKYYGYRSSSDDVATYTDSERAILAKYSRYSADGSVLKVCFNPMMKPYSFVEDGVMVGMLPDVIGNFLDTLGISYEFLTPASEEEYRRMYELGEADVFPGEYGSLTAEAQKMYVFTDSYFTIKTGIVTRNVMHDEIRTVGIAATNNFGEDVRLPGSEIREYDTEDDLINAVKAGEIDAAFMLNYTGQMYVNHDRLGNLAYVSQSGVQFPLSFAINNNLPHEICSIFNKNISIIEGEDINALGLGYVDSDPADIGLVEYLQLNPLVAVVMFAFILAGVVAIMVLAFITWRRGMQRKNQQQLRNYEQLLITGTTDTYKGVRRVDLETGQSDYIYYKDGLAGQYQLGDWDAWLMSQRDNVYPDDFDSVMAGLGFAHLSILDVGMTFRQDYRSAGVNENDFNRIYSSTVSIAYSEGRKVAIIATIDNTEVVEDELRKKKIVEDALKQAESASKAKTTFLFNMSHDIRTPMNAIIGFTALASAHIDEPKLVEDYLRKIGSSSNHLLSLINDVLDMSRIENGRIQLEETLCSLSEILHNLGDIVQSDLKNGGLKLNIRTVGVFDDMVMCDRLRLNQVLLNLLGNAIKFTMPDGVIDITVVERNDGMDSRQWFEFHVEDTGIGMSEDFLEHVFEPFEREHSSTVSGIQGTGLGMSITKSVVEIMGGTISVTSAKNKGTHFVVSVPLAIVPDNEWKLPGELIGASATMVSDNGPDGPELAAMLRHIGLGTRLLVMRDGSVGELSDMLDGVDGQASLYFVDVEALPVSGRDIAEFIKSDVDMVAPVILVTASDWANDNARQMEDSGVYGVRKPVFVSDLKECISYIYGPREERQQEKRPDRKKIAGSRILLVDDNEFNREIAVELLKDAGLKVDEAVNGKNAVDMLTERGAGYYDLVIMDVQMPVMDGYEATRVIRGLDDPGLAHIPIIAMTANAFEEDKRKALEAGMDAHMSKPIVVEELLDRLDGLLCDRK